MECGGWKKRVCSLDGSQGISQSKQEVFVLTLSLGRRGGQSWDSLSLKVCPSEVREHADLSMVVTFLHTMGKFGGCVAQDELCGNK